MAFFKLFCCGLLALLLVCPVVAQGDERGQSAGTLWVVSVTKRMSMYEAATLEFQVCAGDPVSAGAAAIRKAHSTWPGCHCQPGQCSCIATVNGAPFNTGKWCAW